MKRKKKDTVSLCKAKIIIKKIDEDEYNNGLALSGFVTYSLLLLFFK